MRRPRYVVGEFVAEPTHKGEATTQCVTFVFVPASHCFTFSVLLVVSQEDDNTFADFKEEEEAIFVVSA